jgi:methanogenic corrinoid protein MtbC1
MSEPTRTELYEAIVEGDVASAADATQTLIDAGLSADEILDGSVVPAMDEVGRLFDEGEYFVPELLMASKATQIAMGLLNPLMVSAGVEKIGCVVIGTVKGDMHDIGKNLVAAMLEGAGFEVVDLGVNVDLLAAHRLHDIFDHLLLGFQTERVKGHIVDLVPLVNDEQNVALIGRPIARNEIVLLA